MEKKSFYKEIEDVKKFDYVETTFCWFDKIRKIWHLERQNWDDVHFDSGFCCSQFGVWLYCVMYVWIPQNIFASVFLCVNQKVIHVVCVLRMCSCQNGIRRIFPQKKYSSSYCVENVKVTKFIPNTFESKKRKKKKKL